VNRTCARMTVGLGLQLKFNSYTDPERHGLTDKTPQTDGWTDS